MSYDNFAMVIPNDISRFKRGTPILYVSDEDKKEFMNWCEENMPSIKKLSIEEIQGVFKYWKQIKSKK